MVDDLVEGRGFGAASPGVFELLLGFLPRAAPEHTGWFGEVGLVGVLELGGSTDRDSGQASERAVHLRSRGLYVRVCALDLLRDARLTLG